MGYPNPGPVQGYWGGFFEPLSLSESICRSVRPRLSGEAAGAAAKAGHGLFSPCLPPLHFCLWILPCSAGLPLGFSIAYVVLFVLTTLYLSVRETKNPLSASSAGFCPWLAVWFQPWPGSAHQYVGPVPDGVPVFPLCGRAVRRSDRWRCPRQGGDMVEEYSGCALPACSRARFRSMAGNPGNRLILGKRCSACSWRCRCCSWWCPFSCRPTPLTNR